MQQFSHKIMDELGIHSRPAGQLVKKASCYKSRIMITNGIQVVDAKSIIGVMSMGAKKGQKVTFTLEGPDEEIAADDLKEFMCQNL